MGMRMMVIFFTGMLLITAHAGMLKADTGVSNQDESVKKLGVAWNIAEDRKIANYAGVYQPEGLDIYMKRYFDQFSAKIDLLTQKIGQLSEQSDRLQKKVDDLLSKNPKASTSSSAQIL